MIVNTKLSPTGTANKITNGVPIAIPMEKGINEINTIRDKYAPKINNSKTCPMVIAALF